LIETRRLTLCFLAYAGVKMPNLQRARDKNRKFYTAAESKAKMQKIGIHEAEL